MVFDGVAVDFSEAAPGSLQTSARIKTRAELGLARTRAMTRARERTLVCLCLVPPVFVACSEYFITAHKKKGQFRGDCLSDCQLSIALAQLSYTRPFDGWQTIGTKA